MPTNHGEYMTHRRMGGKGQLSIPKQHRRELVRSADCGTGGIQSGDLDRFASPAWTEILPSRHIVKQ